MPSLQRISAVRPMRALLLVLLCVLPLLHVSQPPRIAQSATDVVFSSDADINMYVGRAEARSATPYPSTIAVSGLAGKVSGVQVRLLGLTHYRPDDLDILLVSPDNRHVLLMSDVGGDTDVSAIDLTFASTGTAMPDNAALSSGTYQPTNYETNTDVFFAPAPNQYYSTDLSRFRRGSPNGTWSLFVMDDYGWTNPGSVSGWSLTLTLDSTAPVTTFTSSPAPNANGWHKGRVDLSLTAVDEPGGAGVTGVRVRIALNVDERITGYFFSGDGARLVLTLDGEYAVSYYAIDGVGNTEVERTATFKIDSTAPEIEILFFELRPGVVTSAGVPVGLRLSHASDDDDDGPASGIARFLWEQRTNGGPWEAIPGREAQLNLRLAPGNEYWFRVRAVDRAGNRTEYRYSTRGQQRVVLYEESSDAIVDRGVWTTSSATYASGGQVQHATAVGREVLFTYSGTSVAWVTTRGANHGYAEFAADGDSFASADLYQATRQGQYVGFVNNSSNGIHTVKVRTTGTANAASGGSRVEIDAFIVLAPVP
jgi:subtilisin-like proprotein convertase family protein